MQLEKARFQADQKRPVLRFVPGRDAPDRSERGCGSIGHSIAPEAWAGASMSHGSGVVRVRVRAEVGHDREWVYSHEKG
jgi:hypothetical protein